MGLVASFMEHVEELRSRFIKCFAAILVAFLVAFTCGVRTVQLAGISLFYPFPDPANSMTILVFQKLRNDLLPPDVTLLNSGVADPLIIQMQIGMFIAIVAASPFIFYQVSRFVAPALYKREKRLALGAIVPAMILFAVGVIFCYVLILPFTLAFMFEYTVFLGIAKTVMATEFVNFVFLFLLAFGFVFEIPLVMVGLTRLGVVRPATWRGGWRYAVVGSLVFGALITPDGSGVTEIIVAVPMCALYAIGTGLSYAVARPAPQGEDASPKPSTARRRARPRAVARATRISEAGPTAGGKSKPAAESG